MRRLLFVAASLALVSGSFLLTLFFDFRSEAAERSLMQSFGAYWSTSGPGDTLVLINNPSNDSIEVALSVLDHRGSLLGRFVFDLQGTDSRSYSLRELIGPGRFGSLEAEFPEDVGLLPIQAVIATASDEWVLDFEDRRNLPFASSNRYALADGLGREVKGEVVLANTGADELDGILALFDSTGFERSVPWSLGARETRRLTVPSLPGPPRQDLSRLAIQVEQESTDLLVAGYISSPRDGSVSPIPFQGGLVSSSGELAGIYLSGDSEAHLWNLSPERVLLEIQLPRDTGGPMTEVVELLGDEAAVVDLREVFGLGNAAQGPVAVRFPPGPRVIGKIVGNRRDQRLVTRLEDTRLEASVAYTFGARLGEGLSTGLHLFNPDSQEVEICVFAHFGSVNYTYPLKRLGPGEYVYLDFLEAQEQSLAGELGSTIPADSGDGQIQVVLHQAPEKRLVALGEIRDLLRERSLTFQGCSSCPPVLTDLDIDPKPLQGVSGDKDTVRLLATFSNDGFKVVENVITSSRAHVEDNSGGYVAFMDGNELKYNNAGATELVGSYYDCTAVQVSEPAGGGGGDGEPFQLDCDCVQTGTLYDFAEIRTFEPAILGQEGSEHLSLMHPGTDTQLQPVDHGLLLDLGATPAEAIDITFSASAQRGSGFHPHENSFGASQRPTPRIKKGTNWAQSQTFSVDERFLIFYFMPSLGNDNTERGIAGDYSVTARWENDTIAEHHVIAAVDDLNQLPCDSSLYGLKKFDSFHNNDYHWGKSELHGAISVAAQAFLDNWGSDNGGNKLIVNDQSLKWGGLFETARGDFKQPHKNHRNGRNVDILKRVFDPNGGENACNATGGPSPDAQSEAQSALRDAFDNVLDEGDHWHCTEN